MWHELLAVNMKTEFQIRKLQHRVLVKLNNGLEFEIAIIIIPIDNNINTNNNNNNNKVFLAHSSYRYSNALYKIEGKLS